jgi:hypothetical protein
MFTVTEKECRLIDEHWSNTRVKAIKEPLFFEITKRILTSKQYPVYKTTKGLYLAGLELSCCIR